MSFSIIYFNDSVRRDINEWPANLRARYYALVLRIAEYGPNLGMPHTRALGGELYE